MSKDTILSKYTERLATQEAVAIDNFIADYVPKWQLKIMLKLPLLSKLFGWRLVTRWGKDFGLGKKMELERWGKLVSTLTITENINLTPTPQSNLASKVEDDGN